jgi:hypothetical protein
MHNANSRRNFLKAAAIVACLAAVSPIQGALTPGILRYHRFAALVNTEFTVFLEDGSSAKLILSEAIAKAIEADFEEFTLRFRGADGRVLPQGTYKFKHKKIVGPFLMFIVPNAGGSGPQYYEAVFNRFVS